MPSPPKRRKTSETTGVAVAQTIDSGNDTRPSDRPSFQSPTRASLARAHPEILERALSRSPSRRPTSRGSQNGRPERSEAKSFGLRDRKAFRPSLNVSASPLNRPRMSGGAPVLSPNRRSSGIQAFSKPPRRISHKIVPSDFMLGSPVGKQIQPAEQSQSNTPEDQLALELGSATKDAAMDLGLDGAFMDDDPLEPELPPTPTQLGLEKAPDRPKGLLSSSPSLRHEKRIKRRTVDAFQGSPLKSSRVQSPSPEDSDDAELDSRQELSAAVLEKRKLRKSLAAELQQLKNDVAELETWSGRIDSEKDLTAHAKGLDRFLSLLTSEEASHTSRSVPQQAPMPISSLLSTLLPFSGRISRPARPTSPLPTNPFALQEASKARSYLTVFAPLTLSAHTSRSSSREPQSLSEMHTLTFTAPPSFPANLYTVTVVYETNPETQSLVSVSVPTGSESKKRRVPEVLRRWIESRLENLLLRLDVTTLCWGINRYWEASVERARLWAQIEHNHGSQRPTRGRKDTGPASEAGHIVSDLRRLIPHLERSTMIINPKSSDNNARVLLSNPLTIDDWTGEPQLRPEISIAAVSVSNDLSRKIDQETKKLFHTLLHENGMPNTPGEGGIHIDAILRATEGALGALFGRT
ncbi:hypothetical protein NUU61_005577 [Penicillium alfredii]|uniref:Uncharacterized protein n=1 Tax=Penicillium alfredii TaxID=1506179 RepID=A0A9W9F9U6_9EURO|nr:uncharacterized protein NUU61_005577 [Penicillium alfredii]KAJ5096221.1 hypothetical protein NUU61_005577 [Penicillium alfredii]